MPKIPPKSSPSPSIAPPSPAIAKPAPRSVKLAPSPKLATQSKLGGLKSICIACQGTGIASSGSRCHPCNGRGTK